jgi:hypothetical protein
MIDPEEKYGCSLTALENNVQRRTNEPRREEVIGGCRKLHNKKFRNMYASPNITRMTKSEDRMVST